MTNTVLAHCRGLIVASHRRVFRKYLLFFHRMRWDLFVLALPAPIRTPTTPSESGPSDQCHHEAITDVPVSDTPVPRLAHAGSGQSTRNAHWGLCLDTRPHVCKSGNGHFETWLYSQVILSYTWSQISKSACPVPLRQILGTRGMHVARTLRKHNSVQNTTQYKLFNRPRLPVP